ncbi:Uncharacterized protein TCM_044338 [Theobroma cacao]|uniref:Uncharacterized protein n=1 Tax=Theobroma cacao TaxID=3641 RepID=A0A061FQV7_THECC|nr:Uncharacterized protein TCM_044338 [Theobroma cacao]
MFFSFMPCIFVKSICWCGVCWLLFCEMMLLCCCQVCFLWGSSSVCLFFLALLFRCLLAASAIQICLFSLEPSLSSGGLSTCSLFSLNRHD